MHSKGTAESCSREVRVFPPSAVVVKVRVEKRDIKNYGEMTVINDGRR